MPHAKEVQDCGCFAQLPCFVYLLTFRVMSHIHDSSFWRFASGGRHYITNRIGIAAWLAEIIFDKYMRPFPQMTRLVLWYVVAWMCEYPKSLAVQTLAPDHIHPKPTVNTIWRYIRMGLQHLAAVMAKI